MTYRGRTYRMAATRWRDREFATLPADAVALEAMAGCYSADTLTDGEITRDHVRLIGTQMGMSARRIREAVDRLVGAGFWTVAGRNWRSVSYLETNVSRRNLESIRTADAARKREERAEQNQPLSGDVQCGQDTGHGAGQDDGPRARALSPGLLVTNKTNCEPAAEDVPRLVRVAYERAFLAATVSSPGWSATANRAVGEVARWIRDTARNRDEATVALVSDLIAGYFADAYAGARRYPLALLAADPGRYLTAAPSADPRAALRAELAEAEQTGDYTRASELRARLRAA